MISEYKIWSDVKAEQLESTISTLLKQGWQLAGGLQVTVENLDENYTPSENGKPTAVYYQAVVK